MATKRTTYAINGVAYSALKAPISIDNYNEHCVLCGSSDTEHVCDIIQYGLFIDAVTSLFQCGGCGEAYYFRYMAQARASETYIRLLDVDDQSIIHASDDEEGPNA